MIRLILALFILIIASCQGKSSELPATLQGWTVIDVRTAEEFNAGHLSNAQNIPYDQIQTGIAQLGIAKDQPVLLYCRSGRRSGIAKQSLTDLGFTHILDAGAYEKLKTLYP